MVLFGFLPLREVPYFTCVCIEPLFLFLVDLLVLFLLLSFLIQCENFRKIIAKTKRVVLSVEQKLYVIKHFEKAKSTSKLESTFNIGIQIICDL